MKTRAITGFFFVLVMLASVLSGAYTFSFFFGILAVLSLTEFYKLIRTDEIKPHGLSGYLLASFLFIANIGNVLGFFPLSYLWLGIPIISGIYIASLYRRETSPFLNLSFTFFGVLYVALPFLFFFLLGFIGGTYQFHLPLSFLLMLWANDTGAYLVGMKFGRHKLFERHSPKKTWEGFIGGVVLCVLVSLLISRYYREYEPAHWVIMAFIISVFGTLGDLTESMLKRTFQVKDSGSLLPGHGGLLDRFDGLLMAAPLVYVFFKLCS